MIGVQLEMGETLGSRSHVADISFVVSLTTDKDTSSNKWVPGLHSRIGLNVDGMSVMVIGLISVYRYGEDLNLLTVNSLA